MFPLCFGIGLREPSFGWAFFLLTTWQLRTRLLRDVLPMRWRDANTCKRRDACRSCQPLTTQDRGTHYC